LKDSKDEPNIRDQIEEIYEFFSKNKVFSAMVPEVRSNISGAKEGAKMIEDVMGIDGRITIVNGYPKACGEIKFGVSNHTARLILTAKEFDPSVNFVMNLKYLPSLIETLQKNAELTLFEFKRELQPRVVERTENSTMQWLIKESINQTGSIPDIIWDKGAVGKEPMMRLFGKNSTEMIEKLTIISQTFL